MPQFKFNTISRTDIQESVGGAQMLFAIDYDGPHHLLVTGPPGSGKTTVSLMRAASGFKVHLARLFAYNPKNPVPAFRKKYYSIEKHTIAEKKNFGKRVEELCSHRKLKQDELAILARIDAADLSRYINGETNIEFFSITKIAEALEVRMFDLFDYKGPLPDNRGFRGKL